MSPVVIARFTTIGEAEVARSALRASGIEVDIADSNIIAMDWLASNALGGLKLVVRQEDAERAVQILAGHDDDSMEVEAVPVAEDEPVVCPRCSSPDITPIPRLRFFTLFTLAIGGAGYALQQTDLALAAIFATALIATFAPSHRCVACGERLDLPADYDSPSAPAPPPSAADLADQFCPRCGSPEYHHIDYRRLKAIPLLFSASMLVAGPMWLLLPKRLCDACGYKG